MSAQNSPRRTYTGPFQGCTRRGGYMSCAQSTQGQNSTACTQPTRCIPRQCILPHTHSDHQWCHRSRGHCTCLGLHTWDRNSTACTRASQCCTRGRSIRARIGIHRWTGCTHHGGCMTQASYTGGR